MHQDDTIIVAGEVPATTSAPKNPAPGQFDSFDQLVQLMEYHSALTLDMTHGIAFETQLDGGDLHDIFLSALPDAKRQEYNCSCCRQFFRQVGGLVVVDANTGEQHALLWRIPEESLDPLFAKAVETLRQVVEASKIKRQFFRQWKNQVALPHYGTPQKGGFNHFAVTLAKVNTGPDRFKTANQNMAESLESFRLLSSTLGTFWPNTLKLALKLFETDAQLACYPFHAATLRWFLDLRETVRKNPYGRRLAWHAVASQPIGRTRFKTTVLGQFIEELSAIELHNADSDSTIAQTKANFLKRVDPKDYMRPKAAPTEGNVAQAEKIFADLKLAPALRRRWLRFEEIPHEAFSWLPQTKADAPSEGVFGHLTTKGNKPVDVRAEIDGGKITWDRLERMILPNAIGLQVRVPHLNALVPMGSFTTAADETAPPILAWDEPEQRNPVTNYMPRVYPSAPGTPLTAWGLPPTDRIEVKGILRHPRHWYHRDGDEVGVRLLVLDGAVPEKIRGLALFPSELRRELHAVRATIEAHSNSDFLEGEPSDGFGALTVARKAPSVGWEVYVDDGAYLTKYLVDRGE